MIPSPSPWVKIQIMSGRVSLRHIGKTLLGNVNKLLKTKSLLTSPRNVFALLPKVNFPTNNLNFHSRWRWWDWIQAICLYLFYIAYLVKAPEHGNKASSEIISNHCLTCVQKCRDLCHVSVLRLFCSTLKIIGWLSKVNLFQSMFVK